MTPAEATAKAHADFSSGAKDEALYGLCDMAEGVGLAYRNGWRAARIAAETPKPDENEVLLQKAEKPAPELNADDCPFTDEIVPRGTIEPKQAICREPPPEIPTDARSRAPAGKDGQPQRSQPTEDLSQMSFF